MPAKQAWSTIGLLVKQAKDRALARKQLADKKKQKLAAMWDSPGARDVLVAAHGSPKDTREDKLKRAVGKLEGKDFAQHMTAVTQMLDLEMSFQEAKDLNVSGALQKIFNDPLTRLPVRVMAKQLVDAWSAQKKQMQQTSPSTPRAGTACPEGASPLADAAGSPGSNGPAQASNANQN